jgi:hypothetical protein
MQFENKQVPVQTDENFVFRLELLGSVISHELFLRRINVAINHVRAKKTNHDLDREAQLFAMPYPVYLPRGRVGGEGNATAS